MICVYKTQICRVRFIRHQCIAYPKAARVCGRGQNRAHHKTKSNDMDGAIQPGPQTPINSTQRRVTTFCDQAGARPTVQPGQVLRTAPALIEVNLPANQFDLTPSEILPTMAKDPAATSGKTGIPQ